MFVVLTAVLNLVCDTTEQVGVWTERDVMLHSTSLVVLGRIVDVSTGMHHYRLPPYNGFLRHDGSRAFATGDFTEEGFIDRVDDFDPTNTYAVYAWYRRLVDKYPTLGVLVGPHYNDHGACNSTFPFEDMNRVATRMQEVLRMPVCSYANGVHSCDEEGVEPSVYDPASDPHLQGISPILPRCVC